LVVSLGRRQVREKERKIRDKPEEGPLLWPHDFLLASFSSFSAVAGIASSPSTAVSQHSPPLAASRRCCCLASFVVFDVDASPSVVRIARPPPSLLSPPPPIPSSKLPLSGLRIFFFCFDRRSPAAFSWSSVRHDGRPGGLCAKRIGKHGTIGTKAIKTSRPQAQVLPSGATHTSPTGRPKDCKKATNWGRETVRREPASQPGVVSMLAGGATWGVPVGQLDVPDLCLLVCVCVCVCWCTEYVWGPIKV
jgi:hypothetical protein